VYIDATTCLLTYLLEEKVQLQMSYFTRCDGQ